MDVARVRAERAAAVAAACCPASVRWTALIALGRKTGQGFYSWEEMR